MTLHNMARALAWHDQGPTQVKRCNGTGFQRLSSYGPRAAHGHARACLCLHMHFDIHAHV